MTNTWFLVLTVGLGVIWYLIHGDDDDYAS